MKWSAFTIDSVSHSCLIASKWYSFPLIDCWYCDGLLCCHLQAWWQQVWSSLASKYHHMDTAHDSLCNTNHTLPLNVVELLGRCLILLSEYYYYYYGCHVNNNYYTGWYTAFTTTLCSFVLHVPCQFCTTLLSLGLGLKNCACAIIVLLVKLTTYTLVYYSIREAQLNLNFEGGCHIH